MGFWLNNFSEFEVKRNRENRLILNFTYVPSNGDGNEEHPCNTNGEALPESFKIFARQNVKVSTGFLMPEKEKALINILSQRGHLKGFSPFIKYLGKYRVVRLEVPNDSPLLHELEDLGFQIGSYNKMLRYSGFYPERKVGLEKVVLSESSRIDEIEFPSLEKVSFGDFLTLEELRNLPYVFIDIEKPLWKKDREKELLALRLRLLKAKEDDRTWKKRRIVARIEDRLFWNHPEVEGANLYDDKFNADVSYIGVIWKNGSTRDRQLYMIDSRSEVSKTEHRGFKILKFKNEREVIEALTEEFHKRRPIVGRGHNQVYDFSQIKYAADEHDFMFDPAVQNVKPRRDFVQNFIQRQKEDLIYIDTLWFARIAHPYLNQGRFGTSFKLGGLAKHLGFDFEKSLSHEQLREVEMRRLAGKTLEIRQKAAEDMIDYSCSDMEITEAVFDKLNPWPILFEMKRILPFCTYTEIAFSPNVMQRLHEWRHFLNSGNLPYHEGRKRSRRIKEIKRYKEKVVGLKEKHLKRVGLARAPKGVYADVSEYYFSLEEPFLDILPRVDDGIRQAHLNLMGINELAFLQYLKAFMVPIFADYFYTNLSEQNEIMEKRFYAKYRMNTRLVRNTIRETYSHLAEDINKNELVYIDHIGDYLLVCGNPEAKIRNAHKIRNLEIYYHNMEQQPTIEQLLDTRV